MDIQALKSILMWCTIINVSLLLFTTVLWLLASNFIYRMHGKMYPMPRETFNAVFYLIMGLYKIFIFIFNVIPWIALMIIF
jgi:hypothetical protein